MKFRCYEEGNELPFGVEYANDEDGVEILHVEWFKTEAEQDAAMSEEG